MRKAITKLDEQVNEPCDTSDLPRAIRSSLLSPSLEIFFQNKQEEKPPQCGYGRCSQCACQAFQNAYDGSDMCGNCGHNFDAHW